MAALAADCITGVHLTRRCQLIKPDRNDVRVGPTPFLIVSLLWSCSVSNQCTFLPQLPSISVSRITVPDFMILVFMLTVKILQMYRCAEHTTLMLILWGNCGDSLNIMRENRMSALPLDAMWKYVVHEAWRKHFVLLLQKHTPHLSRNQSVHTISVTTTRAWMTRTVS